MERKFKAGDQIRIVEESDMGYKYHHVYLVETVTETGYNLRSMRYGRLYEEDELLNAVLNLLSNPNSYQTVGEFFDNYYRLATTTETLLYGREKV